MTPSIGEAVALDASLDDNQIAYITSTSDFKTAATPEEGAGILQTMFALAKTMEGGFGERSSATRFSHVLKDASPEGPIQTAAAAMARQNLSLNGL